MQRSRTFEISRACGAILFRIAEGAGANFAIEQEETSRSVGDPLQSLDDIRDGRFLLDLLGDEPL